MTPEETFAKNVPLAHRVALEKRAGDVINELVVENGKLAARNAELETKVANYERREKAVTIARTMEDRGLLSNRTFDEKVAHVLRHDDLSQIESAVDLASDGGSKIASVADVADRGTNPTSAAVRFFTNPDEDLVND